MQDSINVFAFAMGHYAFIIVIGLISYLLGLQLTKRLTYDSLFEEISLCVSLGLGLIACLVFWLGIIGLLYRSVVLVVLATGIAISYSVPQQVAKRILSWRRRVPLRANAFLIVICLVLSGPISVLPLYPPTQFDATFYFLASAKIYVQHHALIFAPYLRFPVLTQLNEMLFTLALLFYDDTAAQLFQWLMLITLILAVIAFAKRSFSKQAGWWSAALLLANPVVLWCGSVAYVDISLALFATTAAYAFSNWIDSRREHWLILSGSFCGFAASTKYPGLFFVLVFGLLTIYVAFRARKYASIFRFAAVVFVLAGPWYIRNFYYTHNPLFPFFPQLFGSRYWSFEDVQGLLADLRLYGVGHSPLALLMLPWSLTFHPDLFFREGFYLPKVYLLGLPIVIVFAIRGVKIRRVVAYLVAFVLFLAFSSQILRYLFHALPALSVATAASLDSLLGWIPFAQKLRNHWAVVAAIFVVLFYGGWQYSVTLWLKNGPIPTSQEQRDNYLANRLASYPAYKLLNNAKGSNYSLYALDDENMAYFADGLRMGDWFGPARYPRILGQLTNGQVLHNELKSMGAEYFLVNAARRKLDIPQDTFFRSHFKPMYERGDVHLFELTDSPFQLSIKNILKNPDFEQLADRRLVGWQVAGAPIVDSSGQYSFSGLVAVHCNRAGDVLYQVVPVNSSARYSFSCHAHSVADVGTGRLQINWLDANGALVHQDLKVIELVSKWTSYEVRFQSPEDAVRATIYVGPLDPSSVWFDEFSFGKMEY